MISTWTVMHDQMPSQSMALICDLLLMDINGESSRSWTIIRILWGKHTLHVDCHQENTSISNSSSTRMEGSNMCPSVKNSNLATWHPAIQQTAFHDPNMGSNTQTPNQSLQTLARNAPRPPQCLWPWLALRKLFNLHAPHILFWTTQDAWEKITSSWLRLFP